MTNKKSDEKCNSKDSPEQLTREEIDALLEELPKRKRKLRWFGWFRKKSLWKF